MSNKAQIILDGKTYEFPIVTGSEGEKAIDIGKLRDVTGYITLDFGYKNTGATTLTGAKPVGVLAWSVAPMRARPSLTSASAMERPQVALA